MPTGSASSQLSQWQRLNAGLSGPLAFEHDFSALDDPASSHDAAKDDIQDLSSADPARVYRPQLGQDLDIDVLRSLDQPGAFTQPYLFDISLLDRRAQPLYGHPHYKPIECMIFDNRPWICFYGGSPPTVVAETDEWWYTMYDREGGCCLQGRPMFLLQTKPLRGCLCLPAMVLPESYQVGPAFARLPTPTYPVTSDITQESSSRRLSAQATDTFLVGELHQEAQNALGPAAGHSASPSGELQAQNATAAEQGRHATKLLRTTTEVVSQHLLGDNWERGLPLSVARALLRKSLEKFTAGALERYIAAAKHFLDFLGLSNRTIASIDVAFLADFLHACENSLEEDREVCKVGPRPILKALSWLGRHAEVPALQPLLQASLIRAFLTQPTTDRKEALPLPMAVVVEWERKAVPSPCTASKFASSWPERKSAPQKKLANIKVSSFGEGVSRFVYSREAALESSEPTQKPEDSQGSQNDLRPKFTAAQIPEDDTEALLVEKFANQAHSSSESDDEHPETPEAQLSTFSLFRNGPWGVIHACRQGDDRAACGASKTSAGFSPSCPLPQIFCKRK
ncbi:unnamed protein product, partial [Symbiodinium microadriaticum]